ncbi:fumarylacetoacetate hydrolase family protein [Candidatus Poriferisocius sp.]|uniref:fumarylacetoacetate hydrolase family protein n=1 Tax=Candidatus Poriferisocius sp. TaxID=3101276 RepID=UPI003B518AE1
MSFRLASRAGQAVLLDGENYWALGIAPMEALGRLDDLHRQWASRDTPDGQVSPSELGPPVPDPKQVFAYGLNYRDHIEEMDEVDYLGRTSNEAPVVFTKFPNCLVGPAAPVKLVGDHCDYECELVVAIGAETRNIDETQAWDRVAGLMIGQDISDRALQVAATPPQFNLGKSRESFGPTGPALVSPDLVDNPDDLAISCRINGELRQNSRTSYLIRPVAEIVAYLSSILTLHPGDLIFTGTPGGVGQALGLYLKPGDVILSEIEGLGTLENTCV